MLSVFELSHPSCCTVPTSAGVALPQKAHVIAEQLIIFIMASSKVGSVISTAASQQEDAGSYPNRSFHDLPVCVCFLRLLSLPPTVQKHTFRSTGDRIEVLE